MKTKPRQGATPGGCESEVGNGSGYGDSLDWTICNPGWCACACLHAYVSACLPDCMHACACSEILTRALRAWNRAHVAPLAHWSPVAMGPGAAGGSAVPCRRMNPHMCMAHVCDFPETVDGYELWLQGGKCDGGDRETTFDDLWALKLQRSSGAAGGQEGGGGAWAEWRMDGQRCEALSAEADVWYDTGM